MTEFTRKQIDPPLLPMQLMERVSELSKVYDPVRLCAFKEDNEISFAGYLVKTIIHNQSSLSHGVSDSDPLYQETVSKAIFISSELDIICLEIHDQNFFIKQAFP